MNRRHLRVLVAATVVSLVASLAVMAQSGVAQTIRYGEIVSAEPTIVVTQATGVGASTGATVGAVAGYALAGGRDRWLGSLLGGAIGGAAGHAAEKGGRKKKGWELIIQVEGGEEIGVQVPGKKLKYEVGQRVRLMTGPGGQTQVKPA